MKIIKKLIFIVLIIIIIVIFLLVKNLNSIKQQQKFDEDKDGGDSYEYGIQKVRDINMFYTVTNCVQTLIDSVTTKRNIDMNNNIIDQDTKNTITYSLLSNQYISRNNINVDNVTQYIKEIDKNIVFVPIKMNCIQEERTTIFIVYGLFQETETMNFVEEKYYIVTLDNYNQSFAIEPILNLDYKDIDEIQLDEKIDKVEKNQFNAYIINLLNVSDMLERYFQFFNNLSLNYSQLAYDKYIDMEYKQARFKNLDGFEKYIDNNNEEIRKTKIVEYLINTYEDYTEYVCRDQYKNLYIFKETAPMEFTLTLDTYTLPNEKFTTTYESSDSHMKVMMNIDKWIQMLNNRDYTSAYNVLDETFRQNNFGSVDEFEEYMRENLPLHYDVEFTDFSDQGQNYVQDIELTDITKENTEVVTKSIIMKLGEGTDFVMSFKIQ